MQPSFNKVASRAADLVALENFVVANDKLFELESLVGRFNIFDALRIVNVEIRHSNFLAWILDPRESHGQGSLFLRAILMDLFKSARESGYQCPVSPIELDGEELRSVDVRREWQNIDLLVSCSEPPFVIAIENKIKSSERSGQLKKYKAKVESEFPNVPSLCVFLTVDGDDPSEDVDQQASEKKWVPYAYGDLYHVLRRVCEANKTSIGGDVLTFIDHYLQLLKGHLMDDPRIEKLCQQIYKNHRRALSLIYKHAGSPSVGCLAAIEEAITSHAGNWHIVRKTSQAVAFIPSNWLEWMPGLGTRTTFDKRCWLVLRFEIRKTRGFYSASVWPTENPELRQEIIKRLTQEKNEFGFHLFLKKATGHWTQLGRESIGVWTEDRGPAEDDVLKKVISKLDELAKKMNGVREALLPIISKHT